MADHTDLATSLSLLDRLSRLENQEQAWREFVKRYSKLIFGWCHKRGLQDADVQDVSQELLTQLFLKMRQFRYDPARGKFRSWLKTLLVHALSDVMGGLNRAGRGSGDSQVFELLEQTEDASDDLANLMELEEQKANACLLELAEARVRDKKLRGDTTWDVWCLLKVGKPTKEVAQQLNIPEQHVLVTKARMIGYLRIEIDEISREGLHVEA